MLERFVLWLVNRLGINVIEQSRLRCGPDAVERGARWEAFYREQGGLADMIADLRREAFEAASELDPRETDKIYYWATADRNLRKLEQKVQAIVVNGRIEADNARALERMNVARIKR